jgi:RNA polymerase sigma-70 factor (ECF subfamily)
MNLNSRQDELYGEAAAAYKHALERLVRAYEASADKQQDLLQDIHVALWQSFQRYEGRCSMRTWVYRVAHNTAASHAMREHRINAKQWLGIDEVESMPVRNETEDNADRRLVLDRLLLWIRQLKPLERQLMLLYLEDMDADSIGEITGISPGNVRVHIHRIKAALAKRFRGAPE